MNDPLLTTYLDRPQLYPHLYPAWETFLRLSKRRPTGFSVGAIPLSEFESYCRLFGVENPRAREWLFVRVDAMDDAFRAHHEEQAEQQKDKAES